MVKIVLMVLLSTLIIDSERRLHLLMKVIAISLGLYAAKAGLFFIRTAGRGFVEGPEGSFLQANNSIGVALAMNVVFLVYLARLERRPWLVWLMRVMAILSYPAVLGTESRGAWLGLALVSLVLFLRGAVPRTKTVVAVVLLAVAASVLSLSTPDRITERYERLENYEDDPSTQSRFWSWRFCTTVGLSRPVLGAGFRFYSLDSYARYMPEFLDEWPGKVWSCHNMWLSVLAEHGVTGLAIWVGLLWSCLRAARRMRRYSGEGELRWVSQYGEMLQAALLGYMLMGTFLDFAYFEVYYQVIGVVIVVKRIVRWQAAPESARPAAVRTGAPFPARLPRS
jgi:probable O-glycosylation ligase (exosortase A-associated)